MGWPTACPARCGSSARLPRSAAAAVIRLMRPRQWSKSLLVFAALVFANELFVLASVATALLAFAAFCLASSSVYVINDLLDRERDREHPEKRHRPIAAGEISIASGRLSSWLRSVESQRSLQPSVSR